MSFWQTFAAANEDAAAAMGEAMVVAGVAITGVVTQPLGVEDGNVPGGKAAYPSSLARMTSSSGLLAPFKKEKLERHRSSA